MAQVRTRKRRKTWSYIFEAGDYTVNGKRKVVEKGGFGLYCRTRKFHFVA